MYIFLSSLSCVSKQLQNNFHSQKRKQNMDASNRAHILNAQPSILRQIILRLHLHIRVPVRNEQFSHLFHQRCPHESTLVLMFSVVDSSSPHVCRNRGCHSLVFASLQLCDFALNPRNAGARGRKVAKNGKSLRPTSFENHRIRQNQ